MPTSNARLTALPFRIATLQRQFWRFKVSPGAPITIEHNMFFASDVLKALPSGANTNANLIDVAEIVVLIVGLIGQCWS